jgi:hypothetical protein
MRPGHGEVMIAEGDVDAAQDRERLIEEFRRQLDQGLWAAVPVGADEDGAGEGGARMVTSFDEIPRSTDRVIFFPRAAGGSGLNAGERAAGGSGANAGERAAGGSGANAGEPAAGD